MSWMPRYIIKYVIKYILKHSLGIWVIFSVLFIAAGFLQPIFFRWDNTVNLLHRAVPLVAVGIGQSIVMLTAGIDLSVGSIVGLTNVIAASLSVHNNIDLIWWFILPIFVGTLIGFFNGVLIGFAGLPALVVTLATGSISLGIALFIMPVPGGSVPFPVAQALLGTLGPVPVPLLLIVGAVLIMTFFLFWTRAGRELFIIGENEKVAAEVGISVRQTKLKAYILSGFWSAVAGLYLSCRMYSGDSLAGQSLLMDSILVAVLGGTSLLGGEGTMAGIIPAALLLLMIYNTLNLLAIPTFYQFVVRGLILIIALALPGARKPIRRLVRGLWFKS